MKGWQALRAHIEAHPVDGSPQEMRDAFVRLAPDFGCVSAPVETTELGGIECLKIGEGRARTMWLHGGGLVFGSPETHAPMVAALATRLGEAILVLRYRLAPEHPWPAPLEDVCACLDACEGPVRLIGDSAGGLLALNAAHLRPRQVAKLALLSPNTDRTGRSTTRRANSDRDVMNDDAQDLRLAKMSFGENIAQHPQASPLLLAAELLPPVWITAATNEVLLDDTRLLVDKLERYGSRVEAHILEGLCHLWMLWPGALPKFDPLFASLARFLGGSSMTNVACGTGGHSSS